MHWLMRRALPCVFSPTPVHWKEQPALFHRPASMNRTRPADWEVVSLKISRREHWKEQPALARYHESQASTDAPAFNSAAGDQLRLNPASETLS